MTEEMFEGTLNVVLAQKQSRRKTARRKPWAPPSMLDAPPAPDGFKHRWIRAETRGFDDTKNISAKMREGWELVRKDEYPDFEAPVIDSGKYEGVFGVGGLNSRSHTDGNSRRKDFSLLPTKEGQRPDGSG